MFTFLSFKLNRVSTRWSKNISKFSKSTYGVGITGKLNRVDENNLVGEDNIIFVTIYNSKNKEYTNIRIKCPNKIRSKCKDYIVKKTLKKLLEVIGE